MTMPPPAGPRPRASYPARAGLGLFLIAELVVLYLVATTIGPGWTVLAILASTVLGGVLLRVMGMRAVADYRAAAEAGEPPGPTAVSGVIGVLGAFLLFVPGFISSVIGLLCVLPPTRFLWRSLVTRFLEKRLDSPSMARFFGPRVVRSHRDDRDVTDSGDVIEGEVVDRPRRGSHGGPANPGPSGPSAPRSPRDSLGDTDDEPD
ncbi:FxsA family protein [Stackebrandtia soli]|uniref:FxsA family protein n=1 Tax=Stackebrandtia soli TaxID=1892856 RepID=UPI0039EA1D72